MILRIFCGNKGTVLPFSYWICRFCRFRSAPDFLRSWAFTATYLASASNFSSAVRQLLTSNPRARGFEQNLWLLFFELVQVFFSDWIGYMSYPLRRISRTSFLHFEQVYSIYSNLLCTHLKHWSLRGRESKKLGYIFCSVLTVLV